MTDTTERLTPAMLHKLAEYPAFPKHGYWNKVLHQIADAWAAREKRLEGAERRIEALEIEASQELCSCGPAGERDLSQHDEMQCVFWGFMEKVAALAAQEDSR